jgi:hypothetical protein
MDEVLDLKVIGDEAKLLCGINERFENENVQVQKIRYEFAKMMNRLCIQRESTGISEAGRNFSIAITDLENSCIRTIK